MTPDNKKNPNKLKTADGVFLEVGMNVFAYTRAHKLTSRVFVVSEFGLGTSCGQINCENTDYSLYNFQLYADKNKMLIATHAAMMQSYKQARENADTVHETQMDELMKDFAKLTKKYPCT
jgi:hypothetical protein